MLTKPNAIPSVLIADDDEAELTAMENLLKSFYEVDFCNHGAIALSMLKEKSYDLLITDLTMPVMGGIELLNVTEALYPTLPAIVVSASSWKYHNYRSNHPNAKHWIDKPYKPSTLLGIVAGTIANGN
jgi:CheY-like chemotaxis protein